MTDMKNSIHIEMNELMGVIMKYSFATLVKMMSIVDIDELQDDMVLHGATKDELYLSSEAFHDITTYLHE